MKQQEKTKRTQERVLEAAIAEFGSKSYDAASLNNICSENQISKGLIYHNFKGKDELYLQCVKICYDKLTKYMKSQELNLTNAKSGIANVFTLRQTFFQENPYYGNIFFNSLLQPPQHLIREIRKIREEFEAFNADCIRKLLHQIHLKEGVTEESALNCFMIFGEMFNGYFQNKIYEGADYHAFMEDHDGKMTDMLNIMLYGIAEEKENDSEC